MTLPIDGNDNSAILLMGFVMTEVESVVSMCRIVMTRNASNIAFELSGHKIRTWPVGSLAKRVAATMIRNLGKIVSTAWVVYLM